ncbi:MAG: UDP-4-amino-4,6-dideoxy-N-acetyl-beta-L-altrosamine transaminase [Candidatus Magasanikbacteria bacterium]|nr:UDP-4-amino-4,6-dideoxy-N-acetyl-beta-L-altrosamine transaminase [Candidatus Magasanikbacteria bacterium]
MIPYGRQSLNQEDINAVVETLQSDWLTQGPKVESFEQALAEYCGASFAVVTTNGTSALHTAYAAADFKPGDEFITCPITFPATSNAGLWQGAKPVFVDCDPTTGLIDLNGIEKKITPRTKAIVSVDYTGRAVDYDQVWTIAQRHNLLVISDACQALGASYKGKKVGSLADFTVFSFHPVKSITTGEGGAVLTNDESDYKVMKSFVTHGISKQGLENPSPGDWYFEMQRLGQNYRLTDLQCALGLSQLKRLDSFIAARRARVARYHEAFSSCSKLELPILDTSENQSAWHLYVVRLAPELAVKRAEIFKKLRAKGIGIQIHHIPTYRHPYYQKLGYHAEDYPNAEKFYASVLSLPLFPDLTSTQQDYVSEGVIEVINSY